MISSIDDVIEHAVDHHAAGSQASEQLHNEVHAHRDRTAVQEHVITAEPVASSWSIKTAAVSQSSPR